jgi:hypothetical protein
MFKYSKRFIVPCKRLSSNTSIFNKIISFRNRLAMYLNIWEDERIFIKLKSQMREGTRLFVIMV